MRLMPKQYTEEEALNLIIKAMEPRVGERAKMKRNLVYLKTALGATWVPVEEAEEGEV
jgi:hypothetical protein